MLKQTLTEYLKEHTQPELAEKLGMTQGAISHMLRADRNVFITTHPDGSVTATEEKVLGAPKPTHPA